MAIAPDDGRNTATPATLQDIVFSCEICHATIPEIYASPESNGGIHGGARDEQGIVTKLWITDCAHVTCTKHLDGGGVPLHPEGVVPTSRCPVCVMKHDDHSAKELYWIQSLQDGKFDLAIPRAFIECPPKILESDYDGMDAVRFQYARLGGYAIAVNAILQDVRRKVSAFDAVYTHERKYNKQLEQDVLDLNARIDVLLKSKQKLKKWEARRDIINHYMSAVSDMAKDMVRMREELSNLGRDWPICDYSFEAKQSGSKNLASTIQRQEGLDVRSPSRKRKHSPTAVDQSNGQRQAARIFRRTSKDMMPPPDHPASEAVNELNAPHLHSTSSNLPARIRPQNPHNSHQSFSDKPLRNTASFPIKRTEMDRASLKPHQVSSSYTLGRTADAALDESARILAQPLSRPVRVADSQSQWPLSNLRSSEVLDRDMPDPSRIAPSSPWQRGDIGNGDGRSYNLHQSQARRASRHWHQAHEIDPLMPNINRPTNPPYSSPFFARATPTLQAQQPHPLSSYGRADASQWQQRTSTNLPPMRGFSGGMQHSEQEPVEFTDYNGHRLALPSHSLSASGSISGVQRSWYTSDPMSDHFANDQSLYSSYGTMVPDQQPVQDRPRGRISLPPSKTPAIRRSDSNLLSQLPGVRGIHSAQRAAAVMPVQARGSRASQAANSRHHQANYTYSTAGSGPFPSALGRRSARR